MRIQSVPQMHYHLLPRGPHEIFFKKSEYPSCYENNEDSPGKQHKQGKIPFNKHVIHCRLYEPCHGCVKAGNDNTYYPREGDPRPIGFDEIEYLFVTFQNFERLISVLFPPEDVSSEKIFHFFVFSIL
jgi:hypothetical protein